VNNVWFCGGIHELESAGSEVDCARRRRDSNPRVGCLVVRAKMQEYHCSHADEFGPEYDRAVLTHGSQRKAEAKLADREKRVEKLNIRDLDPTEHERFSKRWEAVQSRFVDSPKGAVAEADDLVSSAMKARGYPVSDFDQRAADISVDHPRVVENYRSAHAIALRVGKDAATTEDLRTAMIHYRSLFEELVQAPTAVERKEVA
jgi:hypothetical protein